MKEKQQKQPYSRRTKRNNGILRMAIVVLAFLLQTAVLVVLLTWLRSYSVWISVFMEAVALVTAVILYSSDRTSSMKAPWIMMMLVLPVFGLVVYFVVGFDTTVRKMKRRYRTVDGDLLPMLEDCSETVRRMEEEDRSIATVARYIADNSGYPVYRNTDTLYFDDAAKGLEAQIAAMEKAEKFIFIEYHAIEMAESWQRIFEVLTQKQAEGVEIRVLYDDMGSIGFVDTDFASALQLAGIQCKVFNPFHFGRNIFLNNRDHRKITVVDGYVGFTGGYNIAEEYFNNTHPYGQWKDTGVCLLGDAVCSLTAMFLEMWNASDGTTEDFAKYLAKSDYVAAEDAFVQPYGEVPTDGKHVGEDVYITMVSQAVDYCWFVTPYLIITDEMSHALSLAARRGVDVRIITPGIPDKKLVYNVTRSYYRNLCKYGVKIYEWEPGFSHAKMCVADDKMAVCGTINLDYRSLYHHFEDAVFMSGTRAVADIRQDFETMFTECRVITPEFFSGFRNRVKRFGQNVLRLVAELL